MALYAFFLAGSNYFAPVICGFIAQYHGWRWVFYWPAIFIAVTVGFLFFFMEETNYTRHTVGTASAAGLTSSATSSEKGDKEKTPADAAPQQDAEYDVVSNYSKRTFAQKLAIIGPTQPNNMLRRFWHILYYVSWPVVFYAGYVIHPNTDCRRHLTNVDFRMVRISSGSTSSTARHPSSSALRLTISGS